MKFKQILPDYKTEYKNYPYWLMREGKHHVFFYIKNSQAARDINKIKKNQELAHRKIQKFLGIKESKKKIIYYLYPDKRIKKQLMGDDWYAQAIYSEFCVHAIYNNKINPLGPHEETHLLSLSWGLSFGFYQEGLAEFMAGKNWHGQSHDECVKEGMKKGFLLSPSKYMDHKSWQKTPDDGAIYFYSMAGSFVGFLINQFGKAKFKRFYKLTNRANSLKKNRSIFLRVFGLPINDAEDEWIHKLI